MGVALELIRCNDLYKLAGFKTFDAYCEARWSFGRARASQLIKAAKTVNNCKQSSLPPPANEGQARPLAKLKPEDQIAVWKAIAKKPAEKITAKVVAKAVEAKLKPKQVEKPKTKQGSTTPESENLTDETPSNESDAGTEEEAAAESITDTSDAPDETVTDPADDDDDGMVVVIDEVAEVDEDGAVAAEETDATAVPVAAGAAAEDDSPRGLPRAIGKRP